MFVRIGLVITCIVLAALVLLGAGAGLGYVHISGDGLTFGKIDDSNDTPADSKIVSADELLRRKGVSIDQPSPQSVVQAPTPTPVTPPAVAKPSLVNANPPSPEKPAPVVIAQKPADPPAPAKPVTPRERKEEVKRKVDADRREIAKREEERNNLKSKRGTDAERARDNPKNPAPSFIIRVAAASDKPITDPAGNVWEAASGFDGGEIVHRDANVDSRFPALFRAERRGMHVWKRGNILPGNYVILLHFAECSTHITGPEQRVFGLNVEGLTSKIDILKEAGAPRREWIKAIPMHFGDKNLVIRFVPKIDQPVISGIEVIGVEKGKGRGLSKEDTRRWPGFRVAAGSPVPIAEPTGMFWLPDLGFEGGQTVERGAIAVENTHFPELYRFERFGMSAWHMDIQNGNYTVNLHFAETWEGITGENQRVFHVMVQDTDLHNLDIFKETGGLRRALVKTFHVAVTNGRLTVQFQNTDKNVAEINGIEVIHEK